MSLHVAVENFIHDLRYREVLPHLRQCRRLADLGSGDQPRFLRRASGRAERCWGLDLDTATREEANIALLRADIRGRLPFEDGFFDQITILAVLEHLEDPMPLLRECFRCLGPGGRVIATTPTAMGIRAHEIIRRLRLIRDVDEGDHHDFSMSKRRLAAWFREAGFAVETVYTFELGMNLLLVAVKPQRTK